MPKTHHYRQGDTELLLTGLELNKDGRKIPDGKQFPDIGMLVRTKDKKHAVYIKYEDLLHAVLTKANKDLKGGN